MAMNTFVENNGFTGKTMIPVRIGCSGIGEWTGTVNIENRIVRNAGGVCILPFYVPFKVTKGIFKWHFEFLKLCLIRY